MDIKKSLVRCNGYFTVEASVIMPMVIITIAFIIYMTFFLYQRCLLTQDAYRLAFWASIEQAEDDKQLKRLIKEKQGELYGSKYIGGKIPKLQCTVTGKEIGIRLKGGIPTSFLNVYGLDGVWGFPAQTSAKRVDPVTGIRKVRLVIQASRGKEE